MDQLMPTSILYFFALHAIYIYIYMYDIIHSIHVKFTFGNPCTLRAPRIYCTSHMLYWSTEYRYNVRCMNLTTHQFSAGTQRSLVACFGISMTEDLQNDLAFLPRQNRDLTLSDVHSSLIHTAHHQNPSWLTQLANSIIVHVYPL